jgi:hypothetical protein
MLTNVMPEEHVLHVLITATLRGSSNVEARPLM